MTTRSRVTSPERDLIGNFLPNVEINRVTLESSPTDENVTATVDIAISDVMDEDVLAATRSRIRTPPGQDPQSVSESLLAQACKVVVVVTTSAAASRIIKAIFVSSAIERGNFRDRVAAILGQNAPTIPQALQTLAAIRNDITFYTDTVRGNNGDQMIFETSDHFKQYDANNEPVYKYHKEISIPRIPARVRNMKVHSFTYMDFSIFDLNIGPTDAQFLNSIYGTPAQTTVLQNGIVDPHKMILLDQRGVPYTGPYHIMEDGRYMAGRFHSDGAQYLTDIVVPNMIVQDFRGFQRSEVDLYLPTHMPSFLQERKELRFLKDARSNHFNARAEIDHDPSTGGVTFEFMVDQEQIFKTNSKYGYMYDNLPNVTKYSLLRPRDYFRLVDIRILRRRVTDRPLGANSLGCPAPDVFTKGSSAITVAQTGERSPADNLVNRFDESDLLIVMDSGAGIVTDEPVEELTRETSLTNMLAWFQQDSSAPLPIQTDGYAPFPFFRNFIGRDDSLTNVYDGTYQYGIELTYEDGFEKYLKKILSELRRSTNELERYHNECIIPFMSAKYYSRTGRTGPDGSDFPDYREKALQRTEGSGNYNHLTRRFTPNFRQHANKEYDFLKICRSYFVAINIVYADAIFRMGNLAEHDNAQLSKFTIDNVISLLRPENSRPEQVSNVLKSFNEVQSLLEDILDVDLIKDSSNVDLTRGGAASSGRSPKTMKVKKFFGDWDDFVDASDRRRPFSVNSLFDLTETVLSYNAQESTDSAQSDTEQYARSALVSDFASKFNELAKLTTKKPKVNTDPRKIGNELVTTAHQESNSKLSMIVKGKNQRVRRRGRRRISARARMNEIAKRNSPKKTNEKAKIQLIERGLGSHRITSEQVQQLLQVEEEKFDLKDKSYDGFPAVISANSVSLGLGKPTFSYTTEPESIFDLPIGQKSNSVIDMLDTTVNILAKKSPKSILDNLGDIDFSEILKAPSLQKQTEMMVEIVNSAKTEDQNMAFYSADVTDKVDEVFIQDESTSFCEVIPREPKPVIESVTKLDLVKEQPSQQRRNTFTKANSLVKAAAAKSNRVVDVEKEKIIIPKARKSINKRTEEKKTTTQKKQKEKEKISIAPQIEKLIKPGPAVGKKGQVASKVIYGTMKKIEKLKGFEKDIKGKPILNKPIYKEVKIEEVKKGLKPGKYKMEEYSDPKSGITKPEKMSSGKKFFTIQSETTISKAKKDPPKQASKIQEQVEKSARKIMQPPKPQSAKLQQQALVSRVSTKVTLEANKEKQERKSKAKKALGRGKTVENKTDNKMSNSMSQIFIPSGGDIPKNTSKRNSIEQKRSSKEQATARARIKAKAKARAKARAKSQAKQANKTRGKGVQSIGKNNNTRGKY